MDDEPTPDYTKYTPEQLEHKLRHIDVEKDPDGLSRLLREIDSRKGLTGEENPADQRRPGRSPTRFFRYHPPEYEEGEHQFGKWRIRDVILGVAFMVCLLGGYRLFTMSTFLRYRPWLAEPVGFAVLTAIDIAAIFYALKMCRHRPWWRPSYPGSVWGVAKDCLVSLKYLLVVFLIMIPAGMLMSKVIDITPGSGWSRWMDSAPNTIYTALILVSMFTLGPIAEEFFFRGFLYSALRSRLSFLWAVLVQALLFCISHTENLFYSTLIFAMGVALAVFYERRRNLLSPILLHMIKNGMVAIPALALMCFNYHAPAGSWEEAKSPPAWMSGFDDVKRQEDGLGQWQYARDRWGSKGSRRWKKEAKGFSAVREWFPDQRQACAKAALGTALIYYYNLNDLRRAVVEADGLVAGYPEQRQECAEALRVKGWAYYKLRDFTQARQTFEKLTTEFSDQKTAVESAHRGLKGLDVVENRR